MLIGDTNGNSAVNAGDVAQTKGQSGQVVGAGNFRNDINANGSINAGDVAQVKANSGHSLP
jgi:Dockerin type I domain